MSLKRSLTNFFSNMIMVDKIPRNDCFLYYFLCWSDHWFTNYGTIECKSNFISNGVLTSQWKRAWNACLFNQDHCCISSYGGVISILSGLCYAVRDYGLVFGNFVVILICVFFIKLPALWLLTTIYCINTFINLL